MNVPVILTAAQMREAEEHVIAGGVSVEALMEKAGNAVAEHVWRMSSGAPILILCGPGNNGGDGYVAARILRQRGAKVRVAALRPPKAVTAAVWAAGTWGGTVDDFATATAEPVIVDALFGTGLKRPLDDHEGGRLHDLLRQARHSIAVDLPSGVDTDTGAILGARHIFDGTVALGALKPAHRLFPAAGLCGNVTVANIGVPAPAMAWGEHRLQARLPKSGDHKFSRGMVAVIGGAMAGAGELAAMAALRAGAGYVLLTQREAGRGTPHAIVRKIMGSVEELRDILADTRIRVALIGPGLGRDADATLCLDDALQFDRPLVVDGDALTLLGADGIDRLKARRAPTVLTPHDGEFSALFGQQPGSKLDRTRAAAVQSGCVIVAKGPDTVLAAPDGRATIGAAASNWLSTAGTGDVLAGTIAARIAGGSDDVFGAASLAIALHGEAARLAGAAFVADDVASRLSDALDLLSGLGR